MAFLLLLALGLVGAVASQAADLERTVNLLTPNQAGVETNTVGFNTLAGTAILRDTSISREGSASLRVVGTGANGYAGIWMSSVFVPDNRGTYTFSVYAYGEAGTKLRLNIEEKGRTGTGVQKTHYKEYVLKGDGWERLEVTATLDTGDSVGLAVQHPEAKAFQVWLDQFQLEIGDKATEWQAPVVTKNLLLYNQATFELDDRGINAATGGGNAPELVLDREVAWQGETSLKITGDGSARGQGIWLWPAFVPDNRGTYTASVYLKGTPGDQFFLAFEEKSGTGTQVINTINGEPITLKSSDWERITFTATMRLGESITVLLRHGLEAPFTVWVDGLQLEQGDTATPWTAPASPY